MNEVNPDQTLAEGEMQSQEAPPKGASLPFLYVGNECSGASRKNPEDSPQESVTVFSDILSDLPCGEAAELKREISPFLPASEASGASPLSPLSLSAKPIQCREAALGEANLKIKARAKRDVKKL